MRLTSLLEHIRLSSDESFIIVCHSNFIRYFVRHFRREGEFGSGDRDHADSDDEGGEGKSGSDGGSGGNQMSVSDPLLDQLSEFKVGQWVSKWVDGSVG